MKPISVCHLVSGDLWAGAETHVANLLPELAGFPGLHVHAIVLNEGLLAQRLREHRVPVTVFLEHALSAVGLVKRIKQRLWQTRTDLLHTHGYKQNILGTVAARLARVPWIVRTEHGVGESLSGWAAARMQVYRRLNALAARHCSAIITVSRELADEWRATLSGRGPRITVVRNGVPVPPTPAPATRIRAELGIGADRIVFGTIGRVAPIKGLADLVEAAALLHRRDPRCAFLLTGEGPSRRSLEARAAELDLQGVVRFLGFTPDPAEVLAALDVFVLPSLGEGVPMALLEALALGKPVIATAVGGVAELLSPGVHGLLVKPGAPAELAQACERLARDPALRGRLGQQARRLVEEQLTARRMATQVHEVYRSLVERGDTR